MVSGHRPGQEQTPPWPFTITFLPRFSRQRDGTLCPPCPAALLFNIHWSAMRTSPWLLFIPKGNSVVGTRHYHPISCARLWGLGEYGCCEHLGATPLAAAFALE